MFSAILEQLKHPVTTLIQRAEQEDSKKGAIKLVIISLVMAIIRIIMKVVSINKMYSSKSWYTDEELAELKSKAFENAELVSTFFKSWLIFAVVIAVIAVILYIIARMVKSEKQYSNTLSMTNNVFIVGVIGYIIDIILSLIYEPLGMIVFSAIIIYAFFSLINAFKDSLDIHDTDNFVLITTAVLVVVVIILYLIVYNQLKSSLGGLSDLTDLF